jgi:hypothetical protein
MIKKMTTRVMNPVTKNFKERTAHGPCSGWCLIRCKLEGSSLDIQENLDYELYWEII